MVGSTRKTLGTTEPASRDLKPSDRFLRLRINQHKESCTLRLGRVNSQPCELALQSPELAKGEVWAGVDSNH